jgi:hypothetical protein
MDLVLKGNDAQKIEVTLKQMYFDRYRRCLAKLEQMVAGAMRNVSSYADSNKDMVREAINCRFDID